MRRFGLLTGRLRIDVRRPTPARAAPAKHKHGPRSRLPAGH